MFAIIRTGGKQYKVQAQDVIKVEKLEVEKGATIALDQVLLMGDGTTTQVGTPFLAGVAVQALVLDHMKADKVIIFKKKRRHTYRRKKGHRQLQTVLRIVDVGGVTAAKPAKAAAAKKVAPEAEVKSEAKAPAKKAAPKKAEAPQSDAAQPAAESTVS